jgi:multidrug efflux pump subunit AcrB
MWLNFFVKNFRVVILLIIIISAWGTYAFIKLPRESNPEVKIPIGIVTTVYPGASPADVEEFVTKKIEAELSGLKGLKKITSNSSNSFSSIQVEFDAKQDMEVVYVIRLMELSRRFPKKLKTPRLWKYH